MIDKLTFAELTVLHIINCTEGEPWFFRMEDILENTAMPADMTIDTMSLLCRKELAEKHTNRIGRQWYRITELGRKAILCYLTKDRL